MFRDVCVKVTRGAGLEATFVVTGNDRVAEIAAAMGAGDSRAGGNRRDRRGDFARLELKRAGREAVLILPAIMPLVRASDVEQSGSGSRRRRGAVRVAGSSHDRLGTNAYCWRRPT
jgi:CTP:molybdopterin cytidylyltransferase MocA